MNKHKAYITFYDPEGNSYVTVRATGKAALWAAALIFGNFLLRSYPLRIQEERQCLYTLETLLDRTVDYFIDLETVVIPIN